MLEPWRLEPNSIDGILDTAKILKDRQSMSKTGFDDELQKKKEADSAAIQHRLQNLDERQEAKHEGNVKKKDSSKTKESRRSLKQSAFISSSNQ